MRRNLTRDYLDVAALADCQGIAEAAQVLARIDEYYVDQHGADQHGADQHGKGRGVAAQVARQLGDPRPADASVTRELAAYRNLDPRWTDWREVRSACRDLAAAMLETEL